MDGTFAAEFIFPTALGLPGAYNETFEEIIVSGITAADDMYNFTTLQSKDVFADDPIVTVSEYQNNAYFSQDKN